MGAPTHLLQLGLQCADVEPEQSLRPVIEELLLVLSTPGHRVQQPQSFVDGVQRRAARDGS